ncbi:hypothetical protein IB292_21175 [Vibrio parahaemolyticus]|uniref:Uncharacterized protein n=1 Tax=Vibrio parahaemolyticus TaxID=670 RepID=A0A9Q3UF15_VIBPH|nr:hypothetical protein [Vibrio parahaemolyticus]MCC3807534.1 hypothetical protein [Vibrio parahaemolyticus]
MIQYNLYELILGLILLLLTLMSSTRSLSLPSFYVSFILLNPIFDFFTQVSLSMNVMLITFILEKWKEKEKESNVLNGIILKNKRLFPFSDNVVIVLSKSPYVFLYLKEGKVIKLRCSLKELMKVQPDLKKINRNTAISPDVKVAGEDSFLYKNHKITLSMILSWGNNPNKKDNP